MIQEAKSIDQFMADFWKPEDTVEFNAVELQTYVRSVMFKGSEGRIKQLEAYIRFLENDIKCLQNANFLLEKENAELSQRIPKFKVYV